MRCFVTALALVPLLAGSALAEVKTKTVEYKHDGVTLKGYLAYDDAAKGKSPGVLVVHEWWGLNDYARKRAEMLAKLGYVAFCVDMYGDGKTTEHPDEAKKMATLVRSNAKVWLGRAQAGLDVLAKDEHVDAKKLASIGYCFGGSTALSLAHAGADLAAVVSFHGALPVPDEAQAKSVKAKLLICHGASDGFIPEDTIQKVRAAYEKAGVDYQMNYYGGAQHSFTVPGVDKVGVKGLKYQEAADTRSWKAMQATLAEAFAEKK